MLAGTGAASSAEQNHEIAPLPKATEAFPDFAGSLPVVRRLVAGNSFLPTVCQGQFVPVFMPPKIRGHREQKGNLGWKSETPAENPEFFSNQGYLFCT